MINVSRTTTFFLCVAVGTLFILGWKRQSTPPPHNTLRHMYIKDSKENINLSYLLQDDPILVNIVRQQFLISPPNNSTYVLKHPDVIDPSAGHSKIIREILKNKTNGFFVECGALDGESHSNTLYLERYLGWSGLLIEADPFNFGELSTVHRKAWLANVCVSLDKYPATVDFFARTHVSRIIRPEENKTGEFNTVQCIPFFTLMLAMNQPRIDYFSLDVEGDELKILKTIPFDRIDIQTLTVEFTHVREGQKAILDFMIQKGYRNHSYAPLEKNNFHSDIVFVKESKSK